MVCAAGLDRVGYVLIKKLFLHPVSLLCNNQSYAIVYTTLYAWVDYIHFHFRWKTKNLRVCYVLIKSCSFILYLFYATTNHIQ